MMPTPQPHDSIPPVDLGFLSQPDDHPRSVMVIDDSLCVRAVLEAAIKRAGYLVKSFPDGLSAMAAMARGEVVAPDLVLLDVLLPRMDGYEVARILRGKAELANTTIVMLTCQDGVLDKVRAKLAGAKEYIVKPFKMPYLVDLLNRYLRTPRGHE